MLSAFCWKDIRCSKVQFHKCPSICREIYLIKEELHPKPKLSMFCALSQNYQHFFFENWYKFLKQFVWETKIWEISGSQSVLYWSKCAKYCLINNSRTASLTETWMSFCEFLNLLHCAYIIFQDSVDIFFESARNIFSFSLRCRSYLNIMCTNVKTIFTFFLSHLYLKKKMFQLMNATCKLIITVQ